MRQKLVCLGERARPTHESAVDEAGSRVGNAELTRQDHSFPCPSRNWLCLLCLRPGFILRWCGVQRCKVLQQQAVDEDVATTDLAKQDMFGSKIEETGI